MHVVKARTTRWVASAALLAGLSLTGASGPAARADVGGSGGFWISTHITLSGSVWQGGGSPYAPVGWTPPKCWLELNTDAGGGAAYTPDEFAQYMAVLYAFYDNNLDVQDKMGFQNIYQKGIGVDAAVGLTHPPYNEGVGGGKWYAIACTPDAGYGDYAALQAALGVANQYEEWFWLTDGAPPAGVPVMNPELLAEYAAANTRVTPGWPDFNPPLGRTQTVRLATLITNGRNAHGFQEYTATATLPDGESQSVHATPESVTFTSSGPMSPSSVTCYFDAAGKNVNMKPCQLTFLKSTAAGYTMYESSMWAVTWDGAPGEPGWTHQIGPVDNAPINNVIVQEIQSVVGH